MEAKQFPEKWAVRGSQEFADLTNRCDKINRGYHGATDKDYYYYLYKGMDLTWCSTIPDGYTEVTLEDLIAHYEPTPKRVRVTKARDSNWYKVGEEYDVWKVGDTVYHISTNKAIGKGDCEIITEPNHPKWMPLTQGKEKVKDIVQIDKYFVYTLEKGGFPITCTSEGIAIYVNSCFNLIPYNPRIAELEEKITSKRSELAELEGELNTLKQK